MVTARQRDAWDRHSVLLALTWNGTIADGKKVKPKQPADFNPFVKRRKVKPIPISFNVLRAVLFPGSVRPDEIRLDPDGQVRVLSQGKPIP